MGYKPIIQIRFARAEIYNCNSCRYSRRSRRIDCRRIIRNTITLCAVGININGTKTLRHILAHALKRRARDMLPCVLIYLRCYLSLKSGRVKSSQFSIPQEHNI